MTWTLDLAQNDDNLQRLAARDANLRYASSLYLLSFLAPLALSVTAVSIIGSDDIWITLLAIVSLVYTAFEVFFIEPAIAKASRVGAGLAEKFDCQIFDLAQNEHMKCELSAASISHVSERISHSKIAKLKNWYNPVLQKLPQSVAAVAAQYTSTEYDMALRRNYLAFLYVMIAVYLVTILIYMIYQNLDVRQSLVTSVVPVLPLLVFLIRNIKATQSLISEQEAVLKVMDTQIEQIKKGVLRDRALLEVCRDNQDALYMRRCYPLLILPGFYSFARQRREKRANQFAESLVSDYLARHPG